MPCEHLPGQGLAERAVNYYYRGYVCEERIAGYPFNLNFNTDGNLYLNGNNASSNANRRVRAVLAYGIVTFYE